MLAILPVIAGLVSGVSAWIGAESSQKPNISVLGIVELAILHVIFLPIFLGILLIIVPVFLVAGLPKKCNIE